MVAWLVKQFYMYRVLYQFIIIHHIRLPCVKKFINYII